MGHLLSNYPKFSLTLSAEFSRKSSRPTSWAHCSSSLTSTSSPPQTDGFGCLIDQKLRWKVRRLAEKEDEIRHAVRVQAQAFHHPVAFFNDLFFQFFQAEVLSGLLYKLKNSPENRYACLVAEGEDEEGNGDVIVGVVDVTVQGEQSVVRCLPTQVQEYVYVSGIAVSPPFRRQKVGTALLKECEGVCVAWGHTCVVLRAYEEDEGARDLYAKAGFTLVSADPPWFTTWLGRKRRILMSKTLSL